MIITSPIQPSKTSPLPSNLNILVPVRETPWNVSPSVFSRLTSQASSQVFKLCEVLNSDPEFNFILRYFEHHKPSSYGVKRIFCIHNSTHTQVFEGTLKNMERECSNPVFASKGKEEEPKADRARVLTRWEQQVAQFSPIEIKSSHSRGADSCSNAKVLPLWHGSSQEVCQSVCETGFTSFGKHHFFDESAQKGSNKSTDKGYFGSGIYFTNSARYASMYSNGHLLLTWVSMREPYPVVNDKPHPQKGSDMTKLGGKEHYQNYNAHYIPVASIEPNNPQCVNYYPCYKEQIPAWDEFVVFHHSQTLPRFWIELGVDFPNVVLRELANAGELLTLILSLLDKEEIQNHAVLSGALQTKADQLLDLPELNPLGAEDQKFLKLAKRLMPEGQKMSPSTLNMLLKSVSTNPLAIASPLPQVASTTPIVKTPLKPPVLSIVSISAALSSTPSKPTLPAIAFGKELWAQHLGDVGVEPPLPPDIHQILQSPCPFFPGKKVQETHLLTLIPQTVNGKLLTLNSLEELVKHPKQGQATQYSSYWGEIKKQYGNTAPSFCYWVLMMKDVIPESRHKSYDAQVQLLKTYCQKAQVSYEVPHLLETATSLFLEYLRTGKRLYSDSPWWTATRCQERVSSQPSWPLAVGGFAAGGLCVDYDNCDAGSGYSGVGCVRKFSNRE